MCIGRVFVSGPDGFVSNRGAVKAGGIFDEIKQWQMKPKSAVVLFFF